MNSIVEKAKDLAHRAHAGQVDKAGRPYIEHVSRVAAAVADDPEAETVAWLHDVREDCGDVFDAEIHAFGWKIERLVIVLTRFVYMPAEHYYARIRRNPVALRVKLADVADNADESRLALLDEATAARLRRKYAKALLYLRPNTV